MYIKKIRLNAQSMGDIGLQMWAMLNDILLSLQSFNQVLEFHHLLHARVASCVIYTSGTLILKIY